METPHPKATNPMTSPSARLTCVADRGHEADQQLVQSDELVRRDEARWGRSNRQSRQARELHLSSRPCPVRASADLQV